MPTILVPHDFQEAKELAAALIEAQGDPNVRVVTHGSRPAFEVSDEVAAKAGVGKKPAKKAAAKKAPTKAAEGE
jgi:hypothetical protein